MNSVLHELLIVTSIRTLVANMRFYYKDIAACILIILAVINLTKICLKVASNRSKNGSANRYLPKLPNR